MRRTTDKTGPSRRTGDGASPRASKWGRSRDGDGGARAEAPTGRRGRSAGSRVRPSGERHEGKREVTGRRAIRRDSVPEAVAADATLDDYIVGRHPVLEALKSGRPINKLLVAEGAEGGSLPEILGKAKAQGIVIQRVPRTKLDHVAGEHHQGVLLYVAPHDYASLDDILAVKSKGLPLVVLLDEVEDPYNLGAILRTAEATGVTGVVIPKRRSVPLTGVVAKVAAGAVEHVPVARVTNLVQAIERLQKEGYWVVGADASATQMYTETTYKDSIALVIGAEGKGLSRLVKERCDFLVKLPMLGQLQSLNASVATGVLLYEVVRQRG